MTFTTESSRGRAGPPVLPCAQRAAYLYGRYEPDPNFPKGRKAVVEAIYEPPQLGEMEGVRLLADSREADVEAVAGKALLSFLVWWRQMGARGGVRWPRSRCCCGFRRHPPPRPKRRPLCSAFLPPSLIAQLLEQPSS